MKTQYTYIILTAILFSSCSIDFDLLSKDKNNFIVAGNSNKKDLIVINDSILPGWQETLKLPIDINQNGKTDFEFNARHIAYHASMLHVYMSRLAVFNDVEVLIDTSSYSNYVFNNHEFTPNILNKNDTINSSGVWLSDFEFNLCYSNDEIIYDDSGKFTVDRSIFEGWNNLDKKFLGYRYFSENDTIYGWLEFEIKKYYNIYVYQTAHLKTNDQ